jgi:hypothetical protein
MPDVLQVTYEYEGFTMSYEAVNLNAHGLGGRTPGMRYYNSVGPEDRPNGMAFYGTQATLFCDRIGFEIYPERKSRVDRRWTNAKDATAEHARNFIECVRSRSAPAASVETGHKSTLIGHLGNIAFKTGRKLRWDGKAERFNGDREADTLLARTARPPWNLI